MQEHDTNSGGCWCAPIELQPCDECDHTESLIVTWDRARMPDCWKCGGLGAHVPEYGYDEMLYVVHRTSERERIQSESEVIASIREAA